MYPREPTPTAEGGFRYKVGYQPATDPYRGSLLDAKIKGTRD